MFCCDTFFDFAFANIGWIIFVLSIFLIHFFLSDVTFHNCTWPGVVRDIVSIPPQFLFRS